MDASVDQLKERMAFVVLLIIPGIIYLSMGGFRCMTALYLGVDEMWLMLSCFIIYKAGTTFIIPY